MPSEYGPPSLPACSSKQESQTRYRWVTMRTHWPPAMGSGCFQLPHVCGRVPLPPVLAPPALAPRVLLALRLCFFFRRARVRPEEQVRPSWLEVKRLPVVVAHPPSVRATRSEEHTSELQSLMRISYVVFCLHKKTYILRLLISTLHSI